MKRTRKKDQEGGRENRRVTEPDRENISRGCQESPMAA